jgi:hypothetical protein
VLLHVFSDLRPFDGKSQQASSRNRAEDRSGVA